MPIAARPSRRKMLPTEGGRAPSSGPPTGAFGSRGGRLPPEPWRSASAASGRRAGRGPDRGRLVVAARARRRRRRRRRPRRGPRRRRRPSSSSPTGRASSGPSRGARPSALARRRSSSRMNSSNRSPIAPHSGGRAGSRQPLGPLSVARIWESDPPGPAYGRWSDSTERRKPARTCSASWFGRERRDERGLEPERRPDRQRAAPRPRVVLGRDDRREADREPAVLLEDQPGQRPREGGPQAQERRLGGRAGGGPTSRNETTPSSSVTHRTASHQSSGPSTGLAMPGLEPAVADADLLLAQVRGTGMGQAVGHVPEDTGGCRLRRSAAAAGAAGAGASSPALARRAGGGAVRRRGGSVGLRGNRRCALRDLGGLGRRPPGRRQLPRPGSSLPSVARSIPSSSTTSVLLAMLSASRSARSASNWSRSISRRTASSGGASDSASSGPPSSTGSSPVMNDSSRLRGRLASLRERRIASVSRVVTPRISPVSGALDNVAPQDGQVSRSAAGRGAEHHWQRGAVPVSGRPWANAT